MRPIANTRSAAGIPTGRLAVWWVVASEIVIFGGLLASYVLHRLGNPEWAGHAAHTNVWLGGTNTFVLLTSSLSAVLAHKAAEAGDGKKAARLLYFTCLGAVAFLCIKAFEWTTEIQAGYTLTSSTLGSFFYLIVGIHALHAVGGITMLCVVWMRLVRVQLSAGTFQAAALFWYFVVALWPILYLQVYF